MRINTSVFEPQIPETPNFPRSYKCSLCGSTDVKLWREWNTFLDHQTYRCATCIGQQRFSPDTDQVTVPRSGTIVPAIPTPDGETFWGYTSVPQDGVRWWQKIPGSPSCWDSGKFSPLSPREYLQSILEDYKKLNSAYLDRILYRSFYTESRRMGNVEAFRRPNGCFRVAGRTFRTKKLALQWMQKNPPKSVLWST